jgi:hypothetical protein
MDDVLKVGFNRVKKNGVLTLTMDDIPPGVAPPKSVVLLTNSSDHGSGHCLDMKLYVGIHSLPKEVVDSMNKFMSESRQSESQ